MGDNNPNKKYDFDRSIFKNIDTEEKAYILGWIASDGTVKKDSVNIRIKSKDVSILNKMRESITPSISIRTKLGISSYLICATEVASDICTHLKIRPGKKSHTVAFPELSSDLLRWAFIRGFFDGDGSVTNPRNKNSRPFCKITTNSSVMRDAILSFCGIPGYNDNKENIYWDGNNAIDFLGKIYDNSTLYLERKKDLYDLWCSWIPAISGYYKIDKTLFTKIKDNAVKPSKARASDIGIDLTLVEKIKHTGELEYYTTNIKIKPPFGWYYDLVPRSSMPKTGYILANSVGIIDRTYTGPVIAVLIKSDKNSPDLQLPAKIVQLVLRPAVYSEIVEVDNIEDTNRNSGGFGSTDVKQST